MKQSMPWVKCFPREMLQVTASMTPDEGYLFLTVFLMIADLDKPIPAATDRIARRMTMPRRKVDAALKSLIESGELVVTDGNIDCPMMNGILEERRQKKNSSAKAGMASGVQRKKKSEENQTENLTPVEFPLNKTPTIKEEEEEIEEKEPSYDGSKKGKGDLRESDLPVETPPAKRKSSIEKSQGTRLPDKWAPPDDGIEFAVTTLGRDRARAELMQFRDYWAAAPGSKGRKADWPATWRNWVRRAAERFPQARAGPSGQTGERVPFLHALEKILAKENGEHDDASGTIIEGELSGASSEAFAGLFGAGDE